MRAFGGGVKSSGSDKRKTSPAEGILSGINRGGGDSILGYASLKNRWFVSLSCDDGCKKKTDFVKGKKLSQDESKDEA